MPTGLRFASALLIATLIIVAGSSIIVPNANSLWGLKLESKQDNGATTNLGTITVQSLTYNLPNSVTLGGGPISVTYNPEIGYVFVRWEYEGVSVSDPNAQSTQLDYAMGDHVLTAVYRQTGAPSNPTAHVGGEVFTANKAIIVAPYLIGILSIVAVAAVLVKRRKK